MANSRRVEKVSSLIKREISQMLINGIKDDRVGSGMVSITDVEMSKDLQHAKVFVSIYGTEDAQKETMEGLKACTSFVRKSLGQKVRLRHTPEIRFIQDSSLEKGDQLIKLIDRIIPASSKEDSTN
jgi:ribosome-binding factor A